MCNYTIDVNGNTDKEFYDSAVRTLSWSGSWFMRMHWCKLFRLVIFHFWVALSVGWFESGYWFSDWSYWNLRTVRLINSISIHNFYHKACVFTTVRLIFWVLQQQRNHAFYKISLRNFSRLNRECDASVFWMNILQYHFRYPVHVSLSLVDD